LQEEFLKSFDALCESTGFVLKKLIIKDKQKALWEKWLKRAMKLDYEPAILEYSYHL